MAGMKWLQGTYTQRFNARHKLWGHLLQGRYKAIPVDRDAGGGYFPTVANYIHLNPVRTKVFDLGQEKLVDYRWSSYPLYLRPSKRPEWLVVDRVLGALGAGDDRAGREWYRKHMQKRVLEIAGNDTPRESDPAWDKIRRGWFFGSDDFRRELMVRIDDGLKGKRASSFSGEAIREHNEAEADKLIVQGLGKLGVLPGQLEGMRKGAPAKMALAWLVKKKTVVRNEWISERLSCGHPANIPGYVRRVELADGGQLAELKEILKSED